MKDSHILRRIGGLKFEQDWDVKFDGVIDDIEAELNTAVEKHGFTKTPMNPDMDIRDRFIILAEEVGEVARALTYDEGDAHKRQEELIQVAAMAIASVIGERISR